MRYKHLTSFFGSVERALAFGPDGKPRYYSSVEDAIAEAIKIGEPGPFSLVTVVELVPGEDARHGQSHEFSQIQRDVYSALINMKMPKREAEQRAYRVVPKSLNDFELAFKLAMKGPSGQDG